jgi:hypothetical protein
VSELRQRQVPPEAEAALAALLSVEPAEERARLLANPISRAVAAFHRLARDEAAARKGAPDWATWAKLVNASRQAVLQAATCRDIANRMGPKP